MFRARPVSGVTSWWRWNAMVWNQVTVFVIALCMLVYTFAAIFHADGL